MSFINHAEQNLHYDQQIEAIENEIRTLQVTMPIGDIESMPEALAASLDELFINLHTVIALKCVSTIDPQNTLIVDAIKHQQALKVLDVGKLIQLMSDQIELLQEALVQFDRDTQSTAMMKQAIAEFFIARQVLVDTAISDSSEADNFCQCSSCLQSTYHQFTAGFDYVCTQCETPFFK
ncbi:MAG: hypothetical protein MUQ51_05690 [Pseudomonadota bacterium]|nr:hypothetical protein [Pseudomonadota bacterium]